MAVKDASSRILKRHRKKGEETSQGRDREVSDIPPNDIASLYHLTTAILLLTAYTRRPRYQKPPEILRFWGLLLVAGAGFEPMTSFGVENGQ